MTLTDYLNETRRILHDSTARYWPDADLTADINKAMQQRDRDTGMNRSNIQFALTAGQASYSITTVASTGTLLFGASQNAFDVGSIILLYSNMRVLLDQVPYTVLTSMYQTVQGYRQVPAGFAKYGAGTIVLGPTPNQNFVTEFDMLVYANALVNSTDADPLPYPWTDPVPFLAAHFAKLALGQDDEAQGFRALYDRRLAEVIATSRGMMIPDGYGAVQGRIR